MLFKVVILESGQRYYCDLYSSIVPKPSSFDGSYDGALLPPKDWQRSSAAGLPRWLDASPRLARVRGRLFAIQPVDMHLSLGCRIPRR